LDYLQREPTLCLLEFHGGLSALACGKIGLATHVDGIQPSEERIEGEAGDGQLITGGGLELVESL
jgi:hypothetical protein